MDKNIVTLLSGGLDSTVMVYWFLNQGYNVKPLYVDYGSKHKAKELECAQTTCKKLVLDLKVIKFDLTQLGNSALTDKNIEIPENMEQAIDTVVPFRNMLLTTLGTAYAESFNINTVGLSPTKEDYAVYRDCRRTFFTEMELTLQLASKNNKGYIILTPFIDKTKEDIITIGAKLKVPFEDTWTCYKGGSKPCGLCPACQVRSKGFRVAGLEDPLLAPKSKEVKKKEAIEETSGDNAQISNNVEVEK